MCKVHETNEFHAHNWSLWYLKYMQTFYSLPPNMNPKYETSCLKNLDNETLSSIRHDKCYVLLPHGDRKGTQVEIEGRK